MSLRARDVRNRCKGHIDPRVMYCIEALAEEQSVLRQQILDVATTLDSTLNAVNNLSNALGMMKDFLESDVRKRVEHLEHEDDLPPVTE